MTTPTTMAVPAEAPSLGAGVATLANWTMMPDGRAYLYVFCAEWRVLTDAAVPIDKFRSSEHWLLVGVAGGEAALVVPGCQVKGVARCDKVEVPPVHENIANVYELGA